MATINIQSQISSNKRRSTVLVFLFIILISILGFFLGYILGSWIAGIIISGAISVIYAIIGYSAGASMALSSVGAMEIQENTQNLKHKQLYNVVDEISIASGLPMPRVYVIPSRAMNAFATGTNPNKSYVAITEGLMEKLNREEIKGVMAHEMGHVKNYDTRLLLLTSVLVGTVILIADIMVRSFIFSGGGRDREGNSLPLIAIGIIFAILAPIFAQLAKLALSRQREYLADATAAKLTGYPEGLASALEKIQSDDVPLKGASALTSEMFIKNPTHKKSLATRLFSTHPPIEDRVKRLRSM